jgi:hypothetical protein
MPALLQSQKVMKTTEFFIIFMVWIKRESTRKNFIYLTMKDTKDMKGLLIITYFHANQHACAASANRNEKVPIASSQ